MDLFIHPENQKILWTLIQKHPLYPSYSAMLPIDGETWFRTNMEELYNMLYIQYKNTKTYTDLIVLNKYAISHLVIKIKKRCSSANSSAPILPPPIYLDQQRDTNNNMFSNNLADISHSTSSTPSSPYILPSYEPPNIYNTVGDNNISNTLIQATNTIVSQPYTNIQNSYGLHMDVKPDAPPQINMTTIVKKNGENVDELAKIQEEMRKLDSQYINMPPQNNMESFDKKVSHAFTAQYTNL